MEHVVKAAVVTDFHAAHGDGPIKPTPPFIPGHEAISHLEKLAAAGSYVWRCPRTAP